MSNSFLFSQTPLVRVVLPFSVGIILQSIYRPFNPEELNFCLLLSILSLLIMALIFLKFKKYISFGWQIKLVLLFLGYYYSWQFQNEYKTDRVFSKKISWTGEVMLTTQKVNGVQTKLILIKQIKIDSSWAEEEFFVNFQSRDSNRNFQIGDVISSRSWLRKYAKPLNPNQFNYASFMKNKRVNYYAYEDDYLHTSHVWRINSLADKCREALMEIFKKLNIKKDELAVLVALTLGDKSHLTPSLKNNYASVGAMHILAVSGLHVGIVFLVMNQLLFWLKSNAFQRWVKAAVLVLAIWAFAFLTGFSSSVQRASWMFSFIIISSAIKRENKTMNAIAGSALIVILINPNVLYELGFQLSYSAVIGIVILHPIFYSWISTKWWLVDKIWSLVVVSLSATLSTLPLTLFYFHQFPNWFLITNILIIPLAFIIVSGSLIVITLWVVLRNDLFLGSVLNYALKALNFLVELINQLPFSKLEDVWMSKTSFLFLIFSILSLTLFLTIRQAKYLICSLVSLVFIGCIEVGLKLRQMKSQFVGLYALEGTPISAVNGLTAEVYWKQKLNDYSQDVIENHMYSLGVEKIRWFSDSTISKSEFFNLKKYNEINCLSAFKFDFVSINSKEQLNAILNLPNNAIFLVDEIEKSRKVLKHNSADNVIFSYDYPTWKIPLESNYYTIKESGYLQYDN